MGETLFIPPAGYFQARNGGPGRVQPPATCCYQLPGVPIVTSVLDALHHVAPISIAVCTDSYIGSCMLYSTDILISIGGCADIYILAGMYTARIFDINDLQKRKRLFYKRWRPVTMISK